MDIITSRPSPQLIMKGESKLGGVRVGKVGDSEGGDVGGEVCVRDEGGGGGVLDHTYTTSGRNGNY